MNLKTFPNRRMILLFRLTAVLVLAFAVATWAYTDDGDDREPPRHPDDRYDPAAYDEDWLTSDRNGDGWVDYAVCIDERSYKLLEAMDYNYDGQMDNFYFYATDVLQRQELDSNYDGAVDIWVYMWGGVYVQRWERDTNFDGVIDLTKTYGTAD